MLSRSFVRAIAVILVALVGHGPVYGIQLENGVRLQPPRPPADVPRVGQPFAMSFCDPAPTNPNDLCGNLTGGTQNPTGGNPPYYFKLDTMGGFLPFGLTLHPNGLVTGTPTATGSRDVRVCAVDQSGNSQCVNYTFNVRQAAAAAKARTAQPQGAEQDPEKNTETIGGKGLPAAGLLGLVGAAVGLGVGLAALSQMEMMNEESCGTAPTIPSSCLGIGRNSSSCNQIISDYSEWCSCMGRTFSTSTGSCR